MQIPKQYWKVLCREKEGNLLTSAFLADQSKFLTSLTGGSESFDDTTKIDEYQTSISEIQSLTDLDFSDLKDFDTYDGGGGAEKVSRTKLDSVEQIKI